MTGDAHVPDSRPASAGRVGPMEIIGRQAIAPDVKDEIIDDYLGLRASNTPEARQMADLAVMAHPWLKAV